MTITTDTKNALGVGDDTRQIVFKRVNEKIQIEENTTIVETETYGNSWIVGSSTNAIVGTNTGTQGGSQQVVGASSRVETIVSVLNINNKYREYFKDNTFEDTITTTADWNVTSSGKLEMTTGEIAQSNVIAKTGQTWTKAICSIDFETGDSGDVTVQLSANNGTNFEAVTLDSQHTFTNTGTDLKFKITASDTVDIISVKITYE